MTEEEEILHFWERRLTWKDWAYTAAAVFSVYMLVSILRS